MLSDRDCKAALKSPKEVVLNDGSGGRGTGRLKLVVRGGRGTWFGSWYDQGKERKKKLGNYPDISLKDARDRCANEVRAILQDGKNPKAVVTATELPTVERMFAGYVASLKAANKVSVIEVEYALLLGSYNAADGIGRHRNASDIDPSDISAFLAKAFRRGSRVTADRNRAYMSAAFNWAIKSTHDYTAENRQDWGIKFNPVGMVKKDNKASTPRDRNLTPSEVKAIWHAVDGVGFMLETRAAIRLLLCCGQRVKETILMEGSEIDFDQQLWKMPAHKTKGRKAPHTIPLPDLAIPILRELVAVHGDGYLFPARFGKEVTISSRAINKAIGRWCKVTGAPHFQTRDLRRTWKSRTGDIGIDRFTRDLIQQHAKTDTGSRFYDQSDYVPKMREAMNRWNEWLAKAV